MFLFFVYAFYVRVAFTVVVYVASYEKLERGDFRHPLVYIRSFKLSSSGTFTTTITRLLFRFR